MTDGGKNKVHILKATRILQSKVGTGQIDQKVIEKSQERMDKVKIDFTPIAREHLDVLDKAMAVAKDGKGEQKDMIGAMTDPIMQLKANAGMFNYPLIGNLANIIMNLLEHIDNIDEQVIQIVEAHLATLNLIISNKMSGDGGDKGKELEKELRDACNRYFAKNK